MAIPVVGAALVIAGGTCTPRSAAESVLRLGPAQWIGKLSYSMYLWHWPILIIAADAAGKSSLPFRQNVVWLLVALGAAVTSFYLVESPIRRTFLGRSNRTVTWAPIGLGVLLILVSLGVTRFELNANDGQISASHSTAKPKPLQCAGLSRSGRVGRSGRASGQGGDQHHLPPSGSCSASRRRAGRLGRTRGALLANQHSNHRPACTYGDPQGTHTMVLYGDSHAAMWFYPLDLIASVSHWKFGHPSKGWCPASMLPYGNSSRRR